MTYQDLREAVEIAASLFARAVEAQDWPRASERAGWWFALALLEAESVPERMGTKEEGADA